MSRVRKRCFGMDAAEPLLQNQQGNARCVKAGQDCPVCLGAGSRWGMKHPASRAFFAYWNEKRGSARAPDRSEIEPGAVRELLGDIFVLSYDAAAGYPFRIAGTRVCATLGCDLRTLSFPALFDPDGRRDIAAVIAVVAEEMLAAVVGVSALAQDGARVHLELLLLPFNPRVHSPLSLTGSLAAFGPPRRLASALEMTSWRYLSHGREKFVPRALRKLAIARGFMVYEGLS